MRQDSMDLIRQKAPSSIPSSLSCRFLKSDRYYLAYSTDLRRQTQWFRPDKLKPYVANGIMQRIKRYQLRTISEEIKSTRYGEESTMDFSRIGLHHDRGGLIL